MIAFAPSLLRSRVMHKRMRPRIHAFDCGVFYLCFPLQKIENLRNVFLSLERWNLLSFYRRDHGPRDGSDLLGWIKQILQRHDLPCDGEIVLMTLPRILGYVFNPVSFWLCFDAQGQLRAALSEVNNTFGEHHSYLCYRDDRGVIATDDWLQASKVFHVSPFLDVRGIYKFRFAFSENRAAISINLFDDDGLLLATSVTGSQQILTSQSALVAFLRYPLVTLKVIFLIHAEALRLLAKGMRYRPKPVPPREEISR